jgi:hypothetical protein
MDPLKKTKKGGLFSLSGQRPFISFQEAGWVARQNWAIRRMLNRLLTCLPRVI